MTINRRPLMYPAAVVLLLACNNEPSSPPNQAIFNPVAAKATGEIVVSSATPDSATQDTTLNITISGSGFSTASVAKWALAGVGDSTQVRTNSTRYVNSRTLVANITISATASTGKWDVVVMSGSKGGIGTEMFTVKARGNVDSDSRALLVWDNEVNIAAPGDPVSMQPAGIAGDGRDARGQPSSISSYQGSFCGVAAKIYWYNTSVSQSGDVTFDPDMDYNTSMRSCGSARTLNFYLSYQPSGPRGAATALTGFTNARAAMHLAPGEVRSQPAWFSETKLNGCDRIRFERAIYPAAANVRVTRLPDVNGARQWRVESEYPHTGMCTIMQGQKVVTKGTRYLPFGYTATEVPSPYPGYP